MHAKLQLHMLLMLRMQYVVLLVLLATVANGAVPRVVIPMRKTVDPQPDAPALLPEARIVNGQQATRGQFPHQVAVSIDNSAFCGGSLIAANWVLTAGHCAYGSSRWTVTLGQQKLSSSSELGSLIVETRDAIVHDLYDPNTLANDVSLLKLGFNVALSDVIKIVNLPRLSDAVSTYEGALVTASGWGKSSDASNAVSDQLNYVRLSVISNEKCAQKYGGIVQDDVLCCDAPGGIGTCNGDSGGPLVFNDGTKDILIGVVSFVSVNGCSSGDPSGYARVTSQLNWIQNSTGIRIQP